LDVSAELLQIIEKQDGYKSIVWFLSLRLISEDFWWQLWF
jgi:hypothetical protein